MRDRHGHARIKPGRERAAGIEPEPADPQHAGAHHGDPRRVRRTDIVGKAHARTEQDCQQQGRDPGREMDHEPAGEIHHAFLRQPAPSPDPMGHRHINQEQP